MQKLLVFHRKLFTLPKETYLYAIINLICVLFPICFGNHLCGLHVMINCVILDICNIFNMCDIINMEDNVETKYVR